MAKMVKTQSSNSEPLILSGDFKENLNERI
nr:MAG TPA: hypothetical protein [Caudoviricetes sp.]